MEGLVRSHNETKQEQMKGINILKGISVQDVPADLFIGEFATFLEKSGTFLVPQVLKIISSDQWADWVKTGVHKELAPYESNWFFIRAAAIARKIYLAGSGVGIETLREKFGANERNGTISSHHRKANAKIIRYSVKELEKMKLVDTLVKQVEDESGKMIQACTKGRGISAKGRAEMDKIATQIYKKLHPRK